VHDATSLANKHNAANTLQEQFTRRVIKRITQNKRTFGLWCEGFCATSNICL